MPEAEPMIAVDATGHAHRARSRRRLLAGGIVLAGVLGVAAVGWSATRPDPPGPSLEPVLAGLTTPVFLTHAGDERLFIVEWQGRIQIATPVAAGGLEVTGTLLDLTGQVGRGIEQGLLGLAFHPDRPELMYIHHNLLDGSVAVAEYRIQDGVADPSSRRVVLTVAKSHEHHNGGWIGFHDGLLYVSIGDGAPIGDPDGLAADPESLLGKILRIDPLAGVPYGIPSDNPFVGAPGRDEVWSYGLRNPWRASIDPVTGHLWIGDVGEANYEEVNRAGDGRGVDFGWSRVEGDRTFLAELPCSADCGTPPVVVMEAKENPTYAIVGGYVSRRPGAPLEGRYLFGETFSGRIWSIPADFAGGDLPAPLESGLMISSFGEGSDGTIHVVDLRGTIHRVVGT